MKDTAASKLDLRGDVRLSSPNGEVLLEVRRRTTAAVDLRGILLTLAYSLSREPQTSRAVCVLLDPRMTSQRVREELDRFRATVRPDVAERVFLLAVRKGKIQGEQPSADPSLLPRILESARREPATAGRVTQQAIKSAVLVHWLSHRGRVGVAEMSRQTGASMPTVSAAFRAMQQERLILPIDGGWELANDLPWMTVQRLAEDHANDRRVIRFTDPNRLHRAPEEMARRLNALQSRGEFLQVDVGGVLGAERYYPDLDITGAPRLDLSVYDLDTSFVRKLDAGLAEASDPEARAVLVLHLTRKPIREPSKPGHLRAASQIECLADLLEIGLYAEAKDFWMGLVRKRRELMDAQVEQE